MQKTIVLCAALLAANAMAEELVSQQDGNIVRLAAQACTNPTVLSRLEPELQAQFRAASAVLQGRNFSACWRVTPAGAFLVYEDGDQGIVPFEALKPLLTI